MMTEQFAVTGMTCAACSAHVEKAVSRLSGVQSAPVNLMLGSMTVTYDEKAVTDALEAYRQSQEDTFSWYLAQHLPKVQDARTVVENGYVFFFIGENADEAEQMFRDFVAAQG